MAEMVKILNGIYLLITSPSGIFSLLCLGCLTFLACYLRDPMMGAFAAFFAIVPACLGYYEHKERLLQNQLPPPPSNLPERGQL